MPLKAYCPSCSEPNEYTLNRPLYCGFCGGSLSSASLHKSAPKVNQASRKVVIEDREQHNEERVDIQLPDKLDVEIKTSKDNGIDIAEIGRQSKTGFRRRRPNKVDKVQVIQQFQIEAGSKARRSVIEDSEGE